MKTHFFLIFCLFTMVRPMCAQEDVNTHLGEIVVTGTRTAKLLKDTPIQTRVISRADIEKSDATDLSELLALELSGVEFSYAMNQQPHLNMSGFGGQSLLILVDGERLSGETMDDVDFSRLTMDNVERIEIVRGAASALYGSNAAGGVINIITRKQTRPWSLHLDGRVASHKNDRAGLLLGLSHGQFQNRLSISGNCRDDYSVKNGPDEGRQAIVMQQVYGHRMLNVQDHITWTPSSRFNLTGRAGYYFRQQNNYSHEVPYRYRDFLGGLRAQWRVTDRDHLEIDYSYDQYDKSNFQRISGLDLLYYRNVQNTVRGVYTRNLRYHDLLTVGADVTHDYMWNTKLAQTTRQQDCFDLFAQYDWQCNERWEMVSALRYDYFSEGKLSRLIPKVNLRYLAPHDVTLRMGYGMGFRAPTLKERYYDFEMVGVWFLNGNEHLRPELSHNFNLGAEWSSKDYTLTANAYYNVVHDKIATSAPYITDDASLPRLNYINLDHFSIYGGEISAQARWQHGLSARISYSYTREMTPTDDYGRRYNNQYIPARPHSMTTTLDWTHKWRPRYQTSLTLNGRALSRVRDYQFADYYNADRGTKLITYPAYTLWKMTITQQFSDWAKVVLAVDNIFNYRPRYYYFNAPMTDGTNVMCTLQLDVDKIF